MIVALPGLFSYLLFRVVMCSNALNKQSCVVIIGRPTLSVEVRGFTVFGLKKKCFSCNSHTSGFLRLSENQDLTIIRRS